MDIVQVVEHLGALQLDPTTTVARSEHIVLWSRIGRYDPADLDRIMFSERRLFEYGSWILPTTDFEIYRDAMRRYLTGPTTRQRYVRGWLKSNAAFRRAIVGQIRKRGPMRSRDLADQAAVSWRTGGWNDGKNVGRMLDALWKVGVLATVGRDGSERIWDLAARFYPTSASKLSTPEAVFQRMAGQLRSRGIARGDQFGFGVEGRLPRWKETLRELVRLRIADLVHVKGLTGEWFVDKNTLGRGSFRPRTTLLSPFDQLVSSRERAQELFGFRFKLELYVPSTKREFGYYVMPILHGDRLIGRIDPAFDRQSRAFRVNAVYAEPDAPRGAGPRVAKAIRDLARWVGAKEIDIRGSGSPWDKELRRLA